MIKLWKRITGIAKLEVEAAWLAREREYWVREAAKARDMYKEQLTRANLAAIEYNKICEVQRANSDEVGKWALEKMDLTNRLESAGNMIEARDHTIENLKADNILLGDGNRGRDHVIETLERKIEEMKKQIRSEGSEAHD